MTELGRLQAILTADDRQFRSKMDAADSKAKATARSVQGTFSNLKLSIPSISGGSVGNLAGIANVAGGNLLTGALTKVAGVMSSGVTTGIAYNKMLETSAVAFETMGRSVTDTQQHLKDLETLGLKTPFELQDLIKASIQMEAFGFSAQDRIKDLRALSDGAAIAAAGTGDFTGALQGTITALGQMRAKGKLSAEEMNQLAERGIPVWDILSKKVGKTKEELMKLSERGQLKGDVAASLLTEGIGQFAGGAGDRLSRTAAGKESNLKDLGAKRAGEDTKQLFESYKASLDEAIKGLDTKVGQTTTNEIGKRLALDLDLVTDLFGGKISAKEFGAAIGPALRDSFVELKSIVVDGGAQLGAGLLQGFDSFLTGATGNAYQSVKMWAQGTIDAAKNVLGIKSPSRVFAEIGEQTIAGFDQGFENGKRNIRANLKDLAAKFGGQAEEIAQTMERVLGRVGAEKLLKKGVAFGPGFFTSGRADIDEQIKAQAGRKSLPPELLFAQLLRESRFNPNAKSPVGAEGLAQFMPGTAKRFNLHDPSDPLDSIRAQADYMRKLFDKFGKFENVESLSLAGYNAGENRKTLEAGRVPKIAETLGYVKEITAVVDAIRSTEASYQAIAAAAPKVRETILHLGSLAGPIQALADTPIRQRGSDGAQAKPFPGQIIQGGGAEVTITAGQEILKLSTEVANLKLQTQIATKEVRPLPAALAAVGQSAPQAASGMNAVTQATKEQITALTGAANKVNFGQEIGDRIGQGVDDIIGALISGSGNVKSIAVSVVSDIFSSLASSFMSKATGGKADSLGGLIGGLLGGLFGGGFSSGGFTGSGDKHEPAGLVHKGEVVFSQKDVQRLGGVANVEALRTGRMTGFAEGGVVGISRKTVYVPSSRETAMATGSQSQQQAKQESGKGVTVVNNFTIQAPTGTVTPQTQQQIAAKTAQALNAALQRNG